MSHITNKRTVIRGEQNHRLNLFQFIRKHYNRNI